MNITIPLEEYLRIACRDWVATLDRRHPVEANILAQIASLDSQETLCHAEAVGEHIVRVYPINLWRSKVFDAERQDRLRKDLEPIYEKNRLMAERLGVVRTKLSAKGYAAKDIDVIINQALSDPDSNLHKKIFGGV